MTTNRDSDATTRLYAAQDALNRMRRAHDRGTGCYLTSAMIKSLSLTVFAEVWEQADPRHRLAEQERKAMTTTADRQPCEICRELCEPAELDNGTCPDCLDFDRDAAAGDLFPDVND